MASTTTPHGGESMTRTKLALSGLREQNVGSLDVAMDNVLRVQIDLVGQEYKVGELEGTVTLPRQQTKKRRITSRTNPLSDSAMMAAICCSEKVLSGIEAIKSFTAPPPQNSIKIWFVQARSC
jgi:hypothetical protein